MARLVVVVVLLALGGCVAARRVTYTNQLSAFSAVSSGISKDEVLRRLGTAPVRIGRDIRDLELWEYCTTYPSIESSSFAFLTFFEEKLWEIDYQRYTAKSDGAIVDCADFIKQDYEFEGAEPVPATWRDEARYMRTIVSVRPLFFSQEYWAEAWCDKVGGEWGARGNSSDNDSSRIGICTIEDRPGISTNVGAIFRILDNKVVHIAHYWAHGWGDAAALRDAAAKLYGEPLRLHSPPDDCDKSVWNAGPAGRADTAVVIEDCGENVYFSVEIILPPQ